MNQFRNKINKLEQIYATCNSLSSVSKYKYITYLNKCKKIEEQRENIKHIFEDKIKKPQICIFAFDFYVSYNCFKKVVQNYKTVIIICDDASYKKIKNHTNTNLYHFCIIEQKKIKNFKSKIYEGEILSKIYNQTKHLTKASEYNVYYNYQFMFTATNQTKMDGHDKSSQYISQNLIIKGIYLNKVLSSMCLMDSYNLDNALLNIKDMIKKEKRAYKNFKSKQNIFNLSKFHV